MDTHTAPVPPARSWWDRHLSHVALACAAIVWLIETPLAIIDIRNGHSPASVAKSLTIWAVATLALVIVVWIGIRRQRARERSAA